MLEVILEFKNGLDDIDENTFTQIITKIMPGNRTNIPHDNTMYDSL